MALMLRQSTAVDVLIGPFLDKTDGSTAEEAETPVVLLSKNGQALSAKNDATTPTHDDAGYYNCELDATDTNTLGTLVLVVEASTNALPVRHEFQVISQQVYDSLFGSSDLLQVDVTQIAGSAVSTSSAQIGVNVVASSDTGINSRFAQQDTGAVASAVWGFASRPVTDVTGFSDTGVNDRLGRILADTDTGLKDEIATLDTGLRALITASAGGNAPDTGAIAGAVWGFSTRVLTAGTNISLAKGVGVTGFNDLSQADVRTAVGLASANLDTQLAARDTGAMAAAVWSKDTRSLTSFNHDTGVAHATWNFASRTVTDVTGFSDTGVNDRLSKIGGDADTGLRDAISDARYVDTGPTADLAALRSGVNIASIRSDTGAASRLQKLAGNQLKEDGTFDTGTGQVVNTFNVQANVTLDTGTPINVQVDIPAIAAGVWSAGSRTLTDIDTGVITSGVWSASARTLTSFPHDTGVTHSVWNAATRILTNYHDTGIDQDLTRINARVTEADTGLKDAIADLDTGLRGAISAVSGSVPDTGAVANAVWAKDARTLTSFSHDTGVSHTVWNAAARTLTNYHDTGIDQDVARVAARVAEADTGLRSAISGIQGGGADTGAIVNAVWGAQRSAHADTGTFGEHLGGSLGEATVDTGAIVNAVWGATTATHTDSGTIGGVIELSNEFLAAILLSIGAGLNTNMTRIAGDTGAAAHLRDAFASDSVQFGADTGAIVDAVWNAATRTLTDYHDTGIDQDLSRISTKLSEVDTGLRSAIQSAAYSDTGPTADLAQIIADTTTLKAGVNVTSFADTGVNGRLSHIQAEVDTGLRSHITATVPTANITAIKAQTDKLTFDTGNEILADIRKVNNVTVTGTGDTGAGDTWRPA